MGGRTTDTVLVVYPTALCWLPYRIIFKVGPAAACSGRQGWGSWGNIQLHRSLGTQSSIHANAAGGGKAGGADGEDGDEDDAEWGNGWECLAGPGRHLLLLVCELGLAATSLGLLAAAAVGMMALSGRRQTPAMWLLGLRHEMELERWGRGQRIVGWGGQLYCLWMGERRTCGMGQAVPVLRTHLCEGSDSAGHRMRGYRTTIGASLHRRVPVLLLLSVRVLMLLMRPPGRHPPQDHHAEPLLAVAAARCPARRPRALRPHDAAAGALAAEAGAHAHAARRAHAHAAQLAALSCCLGFRGYA